jgi:hypothetical protein
MDFFNAKFNNSICLSTTSINGQTDGSLPPTNKLIGLQIGKNEPQFQRKNLIEDRRKSGVVIKSLDGGGMRLFDQIVSPG